GFTYQLDIDKVSNADEILSTIIKDKQLNVLFASKSVSGNGVKAMIFLKELLFLRENWTAEQYRSLYHSATEILRDYFMKEYRVSIDTQMKAISQPFFLYYSPDIFVNKTLQQWI
ncbi:MAG TPA: BT4734/BF3469 family protein, partial [Flavisolibacter sp.]|nr:BT4734/BF3469 family protein [Flavisolibacter sp.]